ILVSFLFVFIIPRHPTSTLFPYTTLFRSIFNDIIDMDKMERRKVQLDNQPVDFTGFLADLENLSGLQAQQKGLSFVMEPTLPLRSEEHTSELQSRENLVCRLLLEKKKTKR